MSNIKEVRVQRKLETKGDFLDKAKELVEGERAQTYGDFEELHDKVARLWSVALGCHVRTDQVLMCLDLLKMGRKIQNPEHLDNYIDSMGYNSLCAEYVVRKTR